MFPVSGVIKDIVHTNKDYVSVHVYIRGPYDEQQDDHRIFAPVTGKIEKIFYRNMKPVLRGYKTIVQTKKGRLYIFMYGCVTMIEVGHGYVTDNIQISVKSGDSVKQGQTIGEIIVRPDNSYAEIYVPYINPDIKVGDIVVGGKTVIYI